MLVQAGPEGDMDMHEAFIHVKLPRGGDFQIR